MPAAGRFGAYTPVRGHLRVRTEETASHYGTRHSMRMTLKPKKDKAYGCGKSVCRLTKVYRSVIMFK